MLYVDKVPGPPMSITGERLNSDQREGVWMHGYILNAS